jgi:alkylation response protein AidB-like acyl-CoA dehydrogenase
VSATDTDLHDELRAVAREVLGRERGDDGLAWSLLAELGWLGLEVPEPLGGAGAGLAEVAVVIEELGRAAAAGPYLGSVVLGVGTLDALVPADGRDELLRQVAAGETTVAVALVDGEPALDIGATTEAPFRLERTAGSTVVHGRAAFVPDAGQADQLLLLASDATWRPVVVAVDRGAAGLDIDEQPLLDETRRVATITATGVAVDDDARWAFAGDPARGAAALFDRAALAVTIDGLGLSRAMLDATVEYAKVREQFGRPIGSFQAVKHACADMAVQIAVAQELVGAAVGQLAAGDPDASRAVSMAKSYAGPAAVAVAGKAMQLHGGIGYTWESGIHTFLKRAALDQALFGSPRAHRRRLASGLDRP